MLSPAIGELRYSALECQANERDCRILRIERYHRQSPQHVALAETPTSAPLKGFPRRRLVQFPLILRGHEPLCLRPNEATLWRSQDVSEREAIILISRQALPIRVETMLIMLAHLRGEPSDEAGSRRPQPAVVQASVFVDKTGGLEDDILLQRVGDAPPAQWLPCMLPVLVGVVRS